MNSHYYFGSFQVKYFLTICNLLKVHLFYIYVTQKAFMITVVMGLFIHLVNTCILNTWCMPGRLGSKW